MSGTGRALTVWREKRVNIGSFGMATSFDVLFRACRVIGRSDIATVKTSFHSLFSLLYSPHGMELVMNRTIIVALFFIVGRNA